MPIDPEVRKTLDLRLAQGEISKEEYKEIIKTLQTNNVIEGKPIVPKPAKYETDNYHNDTSYNVNRAQEVSAGVKNAIASTKSYVGPAFLAWILYYIGFYIIGLIVNICYLSSANRIRRETGISPSGKGCLQFLLFVHFWIPLIIILILIFVCTQMGFHMSDFLRDIERFFENLL
ncbi:MAG: hypothetical protein JW715_12930 [Sedimentisphaerales bacterium]|nr:hypothetical protein [Sedimentisphaerales bacterium]